MSTTLTNIKVIKADSLSEIKRFLNVPYDIYRGQAAWAPPLRIERKEQLDPQKNPSARILDRQLFLAIQDGRDVGRIAAFTNPVHDTQHDSETAFFGYFDAIDDADILSLLLTTAQDWAKEKGRTRMVGPAQWGVNEEVGLLMRGYEHSNVILMPYGQPHYPPAVEAAGFVKAVDMLALQANLHEGFPRPKLARLMYEYGKKSEAISWRAIDKSDFAAEIKLAMDVFNDAWSENWGFLPFSDEDLQHLAKEMKPLIVPDRFLMGYIDGELAAFICILPDINELASGFDGKLLPFNWAKLIYRLKAQKAKQCRIPLMGLKRKYHNTRNGLALTTSICEEALNSARDDGFTHCEFSWILEDNEGMIAIALQAAADAYKTYRMYEKQLG